MAFLYQQKITVPDFFININKLLNEENNSAYIDFIRQQKL